MGQQGSLAKCKTSFLFSSRVSAKIFWRQTKSLYEGHLITIGVRKFTLCQANSIVQLVRSTGQVDFAPPSLGKVHF